MRWAAICATVLALGGSVQAQPSSDAKTVEALVSKLYEGYKTGGDPEKSAKVLPFDDSLKGLVAKVEKVNSEGVGFDPFCSCQDWDDFNATVKATQATPQAATVVARFTNLGDKITVTYKLVNTPKGWRIHDMVLPEASSFRALLAELANP